MNLSNIKVIAFDADDTLWENENYFREAEAEFAKLLSGYETENKIMQEVLKMEMKNLPLYGYGIKGFILSLIELAAELTNGNITAEISNGILNIGKKMLNEPIVLIPEIKTVLEKLQGEYKIIVATKGDLLDQEKKLERSNLLPYFHHIEVMSEKKEDDYLKLLKHLDIQASELLMIGNSLKSDVLPLINIGAQAIHVPYHTTWIMEQVKQADLKDKTYITLSKITELLDILKL